MYILGYWSKYKIYFDFFKVNWFAEKQIPSAKLTIYVIYQVLPFQRSEVATS